MKKLQDIDINTVRGWYYFCGVPFLSLITLMGIRHMFRFRNDSFKNPLENALDYVLNGGDGTVLGAVVIGVVIFALRRLESILLRDEDRFTDVEEEGS